MTETTANIWWFYYDINGPFAEAIAKHPNLLTNYVIQSTFFFPFAIMLAAFIVLLIIRKVKDWYLRATIGLLVSALVLRILITAIMYFDYKNMLKDADSLVYFEMKVSLFEYTLPVYLFQTVLLALLFSAHTTYKAMSELLLPHAQDEETAKSGEDDAFMNYQRQKSHTLKHRYFVYLQVFVILSLAVFITFSLFTDDEGYSAANKMPLWHKFCIGFPIVALYCV